MALVFGWTPDRGDGVASGNYSTFNNPANGLGNAGFVDTGVLTEFGDRIFGGVVSADQQSVDQPTPPPTPDQLALLSRSINRIRPASTWTVAEIVAWAKTLPPGSIMYVTFR